MSLHHELVEWLRYSGVGDLHCHSRYSHCAPGVAVDDIVRAAEKAQMPMTLTDHFPNLVLGKDSYRLLQLDQQRAKLLEQRDPGRSRLADYIKTIRSYQSPLLRLGTELDPTYDGEIVFLPEFADEFSLFIGHVSYLRSLNEHQSNDSVMNDWRAQTQALLRAGVDILAHPFRILEGNGISFDAASEIDWLVKAAAEAGVALELNAHKKLPKLDELMIRAARSMGVPVAISTDSHSLPELLDFSYHGEVLERVGVRSDQFDDVLFHGQSRRQLKPSACLFG